MVNPLRLSALLFAGNAFAAYSELFFATEESDWKCPRLSFKCIAPSICAHEGLLDKYYCCAPEDDAVCWTGSESCKGSDGGPSSTQLGCGSDNGYCCLSGREECTQRRNQINICWATPPNPMAGIGPTRVNETYSSLLSASPSASTLAFKAEVFQSSSTSTPVATPSAATEPTISTSTQVAATTQANTATSSTIQPESSSSSSGISGGAIAGIVVGVIGGLALIGAGAFFLFKRKKNDAGIELDGNPYNSNAYAHIGPPQEKYSSNAAHEVHSPVQSFPPVEMDGSGYKPIEMEGSNPPARQQGTGN
ncbi:hypothetical protein BU24DRAFT_489676 [Aaosphaeria arxii CBS 175.79]|uniref:Mid2 domain-containing protein n=1 Tax=Aaosphaeria arxii CBS 175.79 TaxID=1450172 RepID=A0A6A5Y4R8_9PLEO|nr:uncharacterized protein BU24DRAFT_489676 [Aaosphaeria arxii CBS 175.79]KAF2019790.1 hypothetical protein BU24DRAFT_489676 [Aaosphaeria arxii CBS 175.79]